MIFIVTLAVGAVAFSTILAIALARVAGEADRDMERALAETASATHVAIARQTHAELVAAEEAIGSETSSAARLSSPAGEPRRGPQGVLFGGAG